MICLGAENMKKFAADMALIETAFTIAADMRDANVTPGALVNAN
jgi:hypothetical protein